MSAFSEGFLRGKRDGGWLRRLTGGGGATERRVCLGAFGKHPGWDDHLDDIGLETATLAMAKQLLYVEGIGGQLNAGAWDRLPEERRLPGFGHVFLWRRGDCTLLGRLWSSTDGKGRGRYPMVLCAEVDGVPLEWILKRVMSGLEALEAACRATDSPKTVRAAVEDERQTLAQEAAGLPEEGYPAKGHADIPWQAVDGSEKTLRERYGIRRQFADYRPGRHGTGRPRELRLSCAPEESPAGTLRTWAGVFDALLDPGAPQLFLLPLAGGWLDVIVGEPVSESFFPLRATPAALPPVDQVPYTLDAAWRRGAAEFCLSAKKFWRAPVG